MFDVLRHEQINAPLDYLFLRFFMFAFGTSELAVRSWAFVCGCAAVFVAYRVGREWFNSRFVGLAAAWMLAWSGIAIYYSQEARPYSLAILAFLINLWAFGRAIREGGIRSWIVYSLSIVVCAYTHYFLLFAVVLEGIAVAAIGLTDGWLARRTLRERLRHPVLPYLMAGAAAAIAFAPWVWAASLSSYHLQALIGPPDLTSARAIQELEVLLALAPIGSATASASGVDFVSLSTSHETALAAGVLVLATIGVAGGIRVGRWRVWLLVAMLLAFPAAWIEDQRLHYFWADRQIVFIVPTIYFLAAAGLRTLVDTLRWALRHFSVIRGAMERYSPSFLVLGALGWGLVSWPSTAIAYDSRWAFKEDWRGAAALLHDAACPDQHIYSWAYAGAGYGVVYYDESLASRTVWWYASHPAPQLGDWVLVPYWAGFASTNPEQITFKSLGFNVIPLPGLEIYHKGPICPGGVAPG
jgi:uncharacterized membrane protein